LPFSRSKLAGPPSQSWRFVSLSACTKSPSSAYARAASCVRTQRRIELRIQKSDETIPLLRKLKTDYKRRSLLLVRVTRKVHARAASTRAQTHIHV
jgi:hypothetical protein